LHNAVCFDPVEFDIFEDATGHVILKAQFFAEEIILLDGARRLLSISLVDTNSGLEGSSVAKIRHPFSGIKVFEVNSQRHDTWTIGGCMDDTNKCHISSHTSLWRQVLSGCGITFVPQWWSVEKDGYRIAQITPQGTLCEENSLRVEWQEDTENEMRLLVLCFALVQTVREAFPSLLHIVQESRRRSRS
jgi:hypothetical protein